MTITDCGVSTADRVLARISVRPPYFALTDIHELAPGMVSATVPGAAPTDPETGPMEAAQVARHLAILGSCAAALARDGDDRMHYLATSAHYSRVAGAPTEPVDEPLEAVAVATWVDKRTARALVKLSTASGRGLTNLDVTYAVLSPRMFGRLHPPVEAPGTGLDPVSAEVDANRLIAARPEPIEGGVRVNCGPIPVEACAGHFPDHPAAPVAVVMGQLCLAAANAMVDHLGRPARYLIEEGHVVATKLASAGQRLVLEAHYDRADGENHVLRGRALADDELVGEVTVTLAAYEPDLPVRLGEGSRA